MSPGRHLQLVPPPDDAAPVLRCTVCGLTCRRGDRIACVMWPGGCTAGPDDEPTVCWWDCDDDQRADLVDAGCDQAPQLLAFGTPPHPLLTSYQPSPEGSA